MPLFTCPLESKKTENLFKLMILLGVIVFFVALSCYALTGFYSRYWADDYCYSALIKENGFWGGLQKHYTTWSNRYAAYLLVATSELFGSFAIRLLPAMAIIALVLSIAWNIRLILNINAIPFSRWITLLLGEMLTFFILYTAPNLFQSLFWRAGMVSYFAPLVFWALINALILIQVYTLNQKHKNFHFLTFLTFVLILFSMGTSETFAAMLTGYMAIVGLGLWLKFKTLKRIPGFFFILLVSLLLGWVIVYLAPGNQVRMDYLVPAADISSLVQISLMNALFFVSQTFQSLPTPLLILCLTTFTISYHISAGLKIQQTWKGNFSFFLVTALVVLALSICLCAPTAYSMQAFPEARALILGRAVILIALACLSSYLGTLSHIVMDKIVNTCLVSILVLALFWIYPLRDAIKSWQNLAEPQTRAAVWDARNEQIQQSVKDGVTTFELTPLNSVYGIYELTSDPLFWVNQCAARYYGAHLIRAVDI